MKAVPVTEQHPLGSNAALPPLGEMSPAGALAHLMRYHTKRLPPMADADLPVIHRQAHRESTMEIPHGHEGAGWEMADLSSVARMALEMPGRRGEWLAAGSHVKVVDGPHKGKQGYLVSGSDVTGSRKPEESLALIEETPLAGLTPAPGGRFTCRMGAVELSGLPGRYEDARRASAPPTEEDKRLANMPATMPEGEMLAHLARLHGVRPADEDRAQLGTFHERMHAGKRIRVPHSHASVEAKRSSRVVTDGGDDLTDLVAAVHALPAREHPPLAWADEW